MACVTNTGHQRSPGRGAVVCVGVSTAWLRADGLGGERGARHCRGLVGPGGPCLDPCWWGGEPACSPSSAPLGAHHSTSLQPPGGTPPAGHVAEDIAAIGGHAVMCSASRPRETAPLRRPERGRVGASGRRGGREGGTRTRCGQAAVAWALGTGSTIEAVGPGAGGSAGCTRAGGALASRPIRDPPRRRS
jgi:hypothetical protein